MSVAQHELETLEEDLANAREDEGLADSVPVDEFSQEFVDDLVAKLLVFTEELVGHRFFKYQRQIAARFLESVVIGDGETITVLQSRQCLDGDTVVMRRDGTATRLKNHEDAWATGVKPTKRYRIRGGSEFIATDNHPVMTDHGWVPAGELSAGDKVQVMSDWGATPGIDKIDRTIEVGRWRTPVHVVQEVTEDLARFLGYMVTDGSNRPNQSLKFTNVNREYLREMAELSELVFDLIPKWYRKGKGFDLIFTSRTHSSYGNTMRNVFRALEWDHGFPLDAFKWSKGVVSEFINRAWSGDGTVRLRGGHADIFLATGNDEVYARYWQALLRKFGVASTVKRETHQRSSIEFYRLVLGSGKRNALRFLDLVGDVFGKEERCQAIRSELGAQKVQKGVSANGKNMYPVMETGPDGEELSLAPIIAIEDAGEREVWDVRYPGKGWFIAQGVRVHNSGKTEVIANVVAALMILLPRLAKIYPSLLDKFANGVLVGCFAPTEYQAETMYGRIVDRLTSERAIEIMLDPEIDDKPDGRGSVLKLEKSGSLLRMHTANPKAKVESKTYHILVGDEAQDIDDQMWDVSISPMGAFHNATSVMTGTPSTSKGVFYKSIQLNKRRDTRRGARQNHFQFNWRHCAAENPNYSKFVRKEMLRLGEDSDEFQRSYNLRWMLDRGMFTTSTRLDELGDRSMRIVKSWFRSPVVVGIDPARSVDSTVVTVCWVNWDRTDEFGYYDHRILNWLELQGTDWEDQYFIVHRFLSNYSIAAIGVDGQGVGDAFASRMRALMPQADIQAFPSDRSTQTKRWLHLEQLFGRGLISWPAHAETRRLRVWRRFYQQMEDLEKVHKGPHILASAPDERGAHDDYADSLALATILTKDYTMPEVQVTESPFTPSRRR